VFGALLMSLLYLGGESAQMGMGLPSAITGLFQGLLLFYLLAADLFITFRLKRVGVTESPPAKPAAPVENAA
jgi:general nucleoside transport system permease protein